MALPARGSRFIRISAVAGIAAVWVAGAALPGQQEALALTGFAYPEKPAYIRIIISDKSAVYLAFEGDDFRATMTKAGLKTAPQIKIPGGPPPREITTPLPIPADMLPAGITAVKANLIAGVGHWSRGAELSTKVFGDLASCREDHRKVEWQCVARVDSPAADAPEKAPAVALPNVEKLILAVSGKPHIGSLGVVVSLLGGPTELWDVRKHGESVEMKVAVLDASGKEVASKIGPLASFGFS